MSAIDFPDRQESLFGRRNDLELLRARASYKGLTAVIARPAMGKSWLFTELARRFSEDKGQPCLVGFAECFGESPDLLLRAIVDLYQRWLGNASYWQQAKMVWDQQKKALLPSFVKVFTKIFDEMSDTIPGGKPTSVVVREGIDGLVAANELLGSGGVNLPTLQYEQARDLVRSVAEIAKCRVVLFLDQWEKSPNVGLETRTLDTFLRHMEDWPACHLFLASLPVSVALTPINDLVKRHPDSVQLVALGEMKLDDQSERDRVLAFLRQRVPAVSLADSDFILRHVEGYAGVVARWTSEQQRERMRDLEDLKRVANDAQSYRFPELESLLAGLSGDHRRFAVRLALVPMVAQEDAWIALRSALRDDLAGDILDDLRLGNVLESTSPPSFGHSKRAEAAQIWLREHRQEAVAREAKSIILRIAATINGEETIHPSSALLSLLPVAREATGDAICIGLCQAAKALFESSSISPSEFIAAARAARISKLKDVTFLLSWGLRRCLSVWRLGGGEVPRDALLDELRALARTFRDEAPLRRFLAGGIVDALHGAMDSDVASVWPLLDELRALSQVNPDDARPRGSLAEGLRLVLIHTWDQRDFARRNAVLDELRALARAYADDGGVRSKLSRALLRAVNQVREEGDHARCDILLEELRTLALMYPDDAPVRSNLAACLRQTLIYTKETGDFARRDLLLDELRALARPYPDDGYTRGSLAEALCKTLIHTNEMGDLGRRDALLDELRGLQWTGNQDDAVRKNLAEGLFQALLYAKAEGDLIRRDAFLNELRVVANTFPYDQDSNHRLAWGLSHTSRHVAFEGDLARRAALLNELQALEGRYGLKYTVGDALRWALAANDWQVSKE